MWVIISTYKEIEKSCSWDTKIIVLVSIWPPSKIFRELQMEPRVHVFNFRPAKNEVLFTFYILCIFYCHYFQIQMKYMCGTDPHSLLFIKNLWGIALQCLYLWEPLLLIHPFLFVFRCKTIPGVLSDDWQQVSSIWKPHRHQMLYKVQREKNLKGLMKRN